MKDVLENMGALDTKKYELSKLQKRLNNCNYEKKVLIFCDEIVKITKDSICLLTLAQYENCFNDGERKRHFRTICFWT